jgi:hypothetical protein
VLQLWISLGRLRLVQLQIESERGVAHESLNRGQGARNSSSKQRGRMSTRGLENDVATGIRPVRSLLSVDRESLVVSGLCLELNTAFLN